VTNDGVTADASGGEGTVTVAQYSGDPVGALSTGTGQYFDVSLSSGNTFTSLVITDCNLNGATTLEWWTGSSWQTISSLSGPSGTPTVSHGDAELHVDPDACRPHRHGVRHGQHLVVGGHHHLGVGVAVFGHIR
jgi:hypothetical protein